MQKYTYIFIITIFSLLFFSTFYSQEQYNATQEINELSEPIQYKPNPIIIDGVNQILNGALSIAQNPHSRPNIGLSVASMIHGIIKIIIEKLAHKKNIEMSILRNENLNQFCEEIIREITEVIISEDHHNH